ncbi:MAG: transglutaminase family protein [Planctomycetia bacterium]|nr:transglutaminase family protein [Planctomycetia bacterium]
MRPSRLRGALVAGFFVALVSGCGSDPQPTPAVRTPAPATPSLLSESWEVVQLADVKAGYIHTQVFETSDSAGNELRRIDSEMQLSVSRFGDKSRPAVQFSSLETPAGRLVSFESTERLGGAPVTRKGKVDGDKLEVEIVSQSGTSTTTLPWSNDHRGLNAVDDELARRPMLSGETRELRCYDAALRAIVLVKLEAETLEETRLLDKTQSLLRVEATLEVEGMDAAAGPMRLTFWVDKAGVVWKRRNDSLGMLQENFLATREAALAAPSGELDIGLTSTVKINRRLSHDARSVKYVVELKDSNPAKFFASGPSQQVFPLSQKSAEIVVRAVRPQAGLSVSGSARAEPAPEDQQPGEYIQSDDARIVRMAHAVAQGEKDPWRVALSLEGHVHRSMRERNFSIALASAADVARSLEGDCTEHAVLLAALARARGIPARIVLGLVYSPGAGGFAFHMWNEVWIDGLWAPVDATLGRGGVGAAHLKLTTTSLSGPAAMVGFLSVAKVMGQLKIEVVEVDGI